MINLILASVIFFITFLGLWLNLRAEKYNAKFKGGNVYDNIGF